jgi:hypothetical protein
MKHMRMVTIIPVRTKNPNKHKNKTLTVMKNKITFLTIATIMVFILGNILVTSCTKEGPEGKPGLDGIDGKDGAESCSSCHNFTENLLAIISQYGNSVHAKGANTDRNGAACSRCHTSMGFRNYIIDGSTSDISNPTPINCRTCHHIHESYTLDDYTLRSTNAVDLIVGDGAYDYGSSNLCAHCHQSRPVTPYPVAGGDPITTTNANARYGPHYGPQANMLAGKGPYPIPGSMPYLNSAHTNLVDNGCVTCHMGAAIGIWGGGHQMNVNYTTGSGASAYQYTGCLESGCHGSTADVTALINPNREEISGLQYQLRDRLQELGFLNAAELVPAGIELSQMDLAAILNYKFVYGDHSYGAHNYRFTKALLVNTLEYLN